MKKRKSLLPLGLVYILTVIGLLSAALWGSRAVSVLAEQIPVPRSVCFVIDAGHGGEDGGATSCTGISESGLNLEISLRLNDLFALLGYDTRMIRNSDVSVYTKGETIAQKKASDLKERVRIANETPGAILLSIHQNHFPDSRYSGPQVFFSDSEESLALATRMQADLTRNLAPESKRQIKPASGIYLMEHITCPGILIECGFLSNPAEEAKLRDAQYQKKLCAVIATAAIGYANT